MCFKNIITWFTSLKEFFRILLYEWHDTTVTLYKNRKNIKFISSFLWLKLSYLIDTPWLVTLRHKNKIDNLAYGETPLTSMEIIAQKSKINKKDHIVELGSGSGYVSLWLTTVIGCKVTAIEKIPVFCWRLIRTIKRFRISGIQVLSDDLFNININEATIIYACLSNFPQHLIEKLSDHLLATLPVKTKIITISYPLPNSNKYNHHLKLCKYFPVKFSWGSCTVFIQEIN